MVRLKARWKPLAAAALVLALGGWWWKKRRATAADGGPAVVKVERGDIEVHFVDSGELAPKTFVDVASKVSGRVIELTVDEGARVRKGQKLAVIQPGRTEAEAYVPTTLTAPIDGVVMRYQDRSSGNPQEGRLSKLGEYVTGLMESQTPTYLLTVADLSRLIVKMKISEMDVLKLKEGMDVKVTIDALPGQDFPSKITLVSPQAEKDGNNLKSFKVEVTLLKGDARLKPGMTARVDGLLDSRKQVLKASLSAVFEEAGKEFAYVTGAGEPKKSELKLGLRSEMDVEVLEGVKEGDKLLTEKPESKKKP
ncbi:MAG: efflux RND transporter periplasmic adaptor subunit [Elusimicrobiota bacterium]|nr:MAG: efflux RND transporter periplasmic adaptor subunit [Elusimicrobiota bacterium]